jgi:dolichol-phosphate mannosyltransferase
LVTILCCVFNELPRAPAVFEKLLYWVEEQPNKEEYEIVLVDNFSTDGTRDWVSSLKLPYVKTILNKRNLGKGGSIKVGLDAASGELVVIFDLDGEYSCDDIAPGIKLAYSSKASLVLGSRTLGGGGDYLYLSNFLGVKFLTYLINALYNGSISDSASGLKFLRRNFFIGELRYSGFNVDFEIVCLALLRGGLVSQFRAKYLPRSKIQGKKIRALSDGISSLYVIFRTRFRSYS